MSYDEHVKLSELRYTTPKFNTTEWSTFNPSGLWRPKIDPDNLLYRTLFEPFNLSHYLSPRLPVDMGQLMLKQPQNVPNVLRMPIKFPGTNVRYPKELKPLETYISRALAYEKVINPDYDETFIHITFDRSQIMKDQYHRYPGFHGDGLQGVRMTPKIKIEHSYIIVTEPPTELCLQPFFVKHLDEAKHNMFLEFDRQAKPDNIYTLMSGHMYLFDPYIVHRSPKCTQFNDIPRTFLRITVAFSELQSTKNTKNPFFEDHPQTYEERIDIREILTENRDRPPYQTYGIWK